MDSLIAKIGSSPRWLLCVGLVLVSGLGFSERSSAQSWQEDVGFSRLQSMVGESLPNGSGVPVALIESLQVDLPTVRSYKPDMTSAEFLEVGDPNALAVMFDDGSNNACSGSCIEYSNHAQNQARNFFGNFGSVAPGANDVTLYEAGHYLSQVLRSPKGNDSSIDPRSQDTRVQSFSWIHTYDDDADDREALVRFDFAINEYNFTALVGITNNSNPLPTLLSHSYNAIAVGKRDGDHSSGLTTLDDYGVGRSKPDLVGPMNTSSASTSTTASVAAFLHSGVAGTDAAMSETMKAILLAGASKTEFPGWSRTATQPLDETFGAGLLNAYNSYVITQGGQSIGSTLEATPVANHGWDYQASAAAGSDYLYSFTVPSGSTASELSIALSWDYKIADTNPSSSFNPSESFANFNLELLDPTGTTLDESISTVDNVEHIYLTDLAAGNYTLKVSNLSPTMTSDYGLAWRMSTLSDNPSADFNLDGVVDGSDFLQWQRGYGALLDATHAEGDADGDGDVDVEDLAFFDATYAALGLASLGLPAIGLAVPEPGTLALIFPILVLVSFRFCSKCFLQRQ